MRVLFGVNKLQITVSIHICVANDTSIISQMVEKIKSDFYHSKQLAFTIFVSLYKFQITEKTFLKSY